MLREMPKGTPVTVIGLGSNLLVRDGGVRGIVIRMGRAMAGIDVDGEDISAGSGAPDPAVSAAARDAGLTGLEFLSGIPGSIGGALRMNAGAYGGEINDILVSCEAVDPKGDSPQARTERYGLRISAMRHSGRLDLHWRPLARRIRRQDGDRDADGRNPAKSRKEPADPHAHRRQHFQATRTATPPGNWQTRPAAAA